MGRSAVWTATNAADSESVAGEDGVASALGGLSTPHRDLSKRTGVFGKGGLRQRETTLSPV